MHQTMINKAKEAIGKEKPTDYRIKPSQLVNELRNRAPELSQVLGFALFEEIAERFEKFDAIAISTQNRFKTYAYQATWAICFAAISGSLLAGLSATDIVPFSYKQVVLFILGFISTVCVCWAAFRFYQIKSQKLLEEWMSMRAKAETERLGFFNSLSRHLVKNYQENIELLLLFVCVFKRYHIEVQRIYYDTRRREHKKSLEKTSVIGAIAAIFLAGGSGVLGMVGATTSKLLPLASIGTISAAISILATRREELNQDERNAERYLRTAEILSKIAEKHDDVLQAVAMGGHSEIVLKYVDAINDQLSLEHRQWISDSAEMSAALEGLENSISDFKSRD